MSYAPSRAAWRRLSPFQIFKFGIFTILMVNLFVYVAEDVTAYLYLDPSASSGAVLEAFAVTIDYVVLEADSLDFSFSGIKTAVLYHVKGQNARRQAPNRAGVHLPDVAASFEEAVVDVLVEKLRRALRQKGLARAIVGGGVAANRRLRESLEDLARTEGVSVSYPDPAFCSDNAAMIGGLGWQLLRHGPPSDLSLEAHSMATP